MNTDDKDHIFSLMEVHRGKMENPELLSPTDYKVSDEKPMPPKADMDKSSQKIKSVKANH